MRFLLAALFIAMFAGCVDASESTLDEFYSPIKVQGDNCSGTILVAAIDASILPLPAGLELLPATNFFNDPTHPDILILTGIKCDEWEETASGVLVLGGSWNVYPLKQYGDSPFKAERQEAGWPVGEGHVKHQNALRPEQLPEIPDAANVVEYPTTDTWDGDEQWLTLTRFTLPTPAAQNTEMSLSFAKAEGTLTYRWAGDVSLADGDCLVRENTDEGNALGALSCDLHSTLALTLDEETISTTWSQTI